MTNREINSKNLLEIFEAWDDSDLFLVIVLDKNGKIRFLNKRMCEFFGTTKQEVIGKELCAVNIQGAEKLWEEICSRIKIKEPFKHEIKVSTKDAPTQTAIFEFREFKTGLVEGFVGIGTLSKSSMREYLEFLDLLLEERTQALRESEAKYRELVELAKSIIFKWDADGKVIWMNEYGLKFFGFSEEEIVGRSVYETFVPKVESTGKDLSNLVREIFENEERYTSNINENVKKDGTRVWIHWSNRPIKDHEGKLVAILSIGTDITDRIKMERMQEHELKKSRAISRLYGLLLSPAAKIDDIEYALLDEAKAITDSRSGFIGRLDHKTREVIEIKFIREKDGKIEKAVKMVQSAECALKSVLNYVWSAGAFFSNSPNGHPGFDCMPEWHIKIDRFLTTPILIDGDAVGVLVLVNSKRDYNDEDLEAISELCRYYTLALKKMKYEEELIFRENLYRTLFEIAPVPTLTVDEKGIIRNINSAFERLSGYTKEEVEGKKSWKEFVHPEDIPRMEAYRAKRFAGHHAPHSYEFRFLDRQRNVHDVLINVDLIPETKKVIASFVDLTETKRLQEDLKRSKEALEKYSKHLEELVEEKTRELREKERLAAIGQTASSIAHDLKSPLQVLINSVYLIKMGISKLPAPLVDQLRDFGIMESLSRIEKQIDYINKILSDLQEVSRPIKPDFKSTRLEPLIQESLQSSTVPANVEVIVRDRGVVSELDPYLMKRVLVNLIENAVQAMPNGGKLMIETSKTESDVFITIKDTGMGMPKDVIENLFQPFFTTKAKGTGLGLSTSKRIIEAHGGAISVESEVGKGTTFTIRIPVKK
ncbi:MAG: PAS domain S-box protein [Candidatus Methanomethyliaceae archaeon]